MEFPFVLFERVLLSCTGRETESYITRSFETLLFVPLFLLETAVENTS